MLSEGQGRAAGLRNEEGAAMLTLVPGQSGGHRQMTVVVSGS